MSNGDRCLVNRFNLPPCCASCLADEATESWRIEAETSEAGPGSGNVTVWAIGIPGIIAWGVGYTLRKGLVDAALALYQPREGRLWFGNKHYQTLFENANPYSPRYRRSSLGV
jgi:hypothetical protein